MNVLIADKFPGDYVDELRSFGCTVSYNPDLTGEALDDVLKKEQPEVLIVRSTRVAGKMIEGLSQLKLIIRAGSGFDTIDVKAASERSISVANCPGMNSIAVAELAFGLMLSLDRRIPDNVIELRQGKWNKEEFSKARGIFGRTLGIIGFGRIGKEMAPRAKAFGMSVIAWSRSLTLEKAREFDIEYGETPETVASRADVLSIHLSLTKETRGMIGANIFDAMKPGSFFINTSRAEVVDQAALLKAMNEKAIRAGLDVFEGEPAAKVGAIDEEIVKHKMLYGTHHIGASTDQAQSAVAEEAIRIVREYKERGHIPNLVNP